MSSSACIEYNKHDELNNRWTNQYIHKHFINQPHNDRWRWDIDDHKRRKLTKFDMKDSNQSIKSNVIPVWCCSRCTHNNIERKSLCKICKFPYSSSVNRSNIATHTNTNTSSDSSNVNHMTLAQFCADNIWKISSVPIWICNQCTYCNIEQLPQCKICLYPYYLNESHQKTPTYYTSFSSGISDPDIHEQFPTDNIDQNATHSDIDEHPSIDEDNNIEKLKFKMTIKLCANKIYRCNYSSVYFDHSIEDLAHHTLIECKLDCYDSQNKHLSSKQLLPAILYQNKYVPLQYKVILPIHYGYKHHPRFNGKIERHCHCSGFCSQIHTSWCKPSAVYASYKGKKSTTKYTFNNNPLRSIAKYVWSACYPELSDREWDMELNEADKNYYSPVFGHELYDVLIRYLPSKDILNHVLFEYMGYDRIDIVKMSSCILVNKDYFNKIKINHNEKRMFLKDYRYLPFKIYNTKISRIRQRNCVDFEFIEIGFRKKDIFPKSKAKNNTNMNNKKCITENVKRKKDRKKAKRASFRRRDLRIFYPKKYLRLKLKYEANADKYHKDGTKKTWREIWAEQRRTYELMKKNEKEAQPHLYPLKVYENKIKYLQQKWINHWKEVIYELYGESESDIEYLDIDEDEIAQSPLKKLEKFASNLFMFVPL